MSVMQFIAFQLLKSISIPLCMMSIMYDVFEGYDHGVICLILRQMKFYYAWLYCYIY